MNCPYCGSVNPDGSTICATCGQSLVAPPAATPAPPAPPESYSQPPAQQPVYAPPPAPPAAPAGYAQPQVVASVPVKNHLVMAILVTLFCCMPFGVVGIIFASQVNSKLAIGDVAGAQQASKNAALWSWLAIGAAVVLGIAYAILMALGIMSEVSSGSF